MNRVQLLKLTNILLLFSFLLQAGSGILHSKIEPALYEDIHEKGGYVLIALAAAHLYFNWGWMKKNVFTANEE